MGGAGPRDAPRMDAPVATGSGYRIMRDHTLVIEIPDGYLSRDAGGLYVVRMRRG